MKPRLVPLAVVLAVFLAGGVRADRQPAAEKEQPPEKATPSKRDAEGGKDAKERKERRKQPLVGFDLSSVSEQDPSLSAPGATRGEGDPVDLLAPDRAKLLGVCPLFEWRSSLGDGGAILEITDGEGGMVLRARARGGSYAAGAGGADLQPGRFYHWQVLVRSPAGGVYSRRRTFVVVAEPERSEIEAALESIPPVTSYDGALARARLLRDHRIWYDAVGAYTDLVSRFPDRPEPYEERGRIYYQIEETRPLAASDFARADELEAR